MSNATKWARLLCVAAVVLVVICNFAESIQGVVVFAIVAVMMLCTLLVCAAIDDRGNRL